MITKADILKRAHDAEKELMEVQSRLLSMALDRSEESKEELLTDCSALAEDLHAIADRLDFSD